MSDRPDAEDRLLSGAEHELVDRTKPPAIAERSREELQALGKQLREARDRARRIGRRQMREMRGKAEPKGAVPARDNTGTEAKAQVLADALKRVTQALRKLSAPTQAQLTRKAAERKRAASPAQHPQAGRAASTGMQPKTSRQPTVKTDPREIGRVSRAVKVAQAKRDR